MLRSSRHIIVLFQTNTIVPNLKSACQHFNSKWFKSLYLLIVKVILQDTVDILLPVTNQPPQTWVLLFHYYLVVGSCAIGPVVRLGILMMKPQAQSCMSLYEICGSWSGPGFFGFSLLITVAYSPPKMCYPLQNSTSSCTWSLSWGLRLNWLVTE
jgi:hypothetical protein